MYKKWIFPLLSKYDAEDVHDLSLRLMRLAQGSGALREEICRRYHYEDPKLRTKVLGLNFENPLCMAAGFDKNAVATRLLYWLGFGGIEGGTFLPEKQFGNPRTRDQKRIHRLPEDRALINALGFPSGGVYVIKSNVRRLRHNGYIFGGNIGPNKTSVEAGTAADDYVSCVKEYGYYVDYLVVNVSSPNTPGLRNLQGRESLAYLLDRTLEARDFVRPRRPLLVKISPDLGRKELDDVLEVIMSREVDGIVATNTTVRRPLLKGLNRNKQRGLSGPPLFDLSSLVVRYVRYKAQQAERDLSVWGVGGITTPQDGLTMAMAGADILQVLTAFIYEGPSFASRFNSGLVELLEERGFSRFSDAVGTEELPADKESWFDSRFKYVDSVYQPVTA